MMRLKLVPGEWVLGNSNSRFPQGEILNVKGSYDQDSHVMPAYKECSKALVEGITSTWLEYVPETYDPSAATPLLISCHGGGQSGWGQMYSTSWYLVAQREGFICVFPDAPKLGARPSFDMKPVADILVKLIDEIKGKYNIDSSRIYMQGMSMGDLTTAEFARAHGIILAGAGCAAGPSDPDSITDENGNPVRYTTPVSVYQARGTNDNRSLNPKYTRWEVNEANRKYWMTVNKCSEPPLLCLDSGECIAYYRGEKADVVYRDVMGRGHGQTIDDAERAWQLLFSHTKRNDDGTIDLGAIPDFADKGAIALAADCRNAYIDNKKVEMIGKANDVMAYNSIPRTILEGKPFDPNNIDLVRVDLERHMYVPVTFLEKAFGASVKSEGETATITVRNIDVFVAKGNTAALVNNKVEAMERHAEMIDGELNIVIRWFAEKIMRKFVAYEDGVLYINDKPCVLTPDFINIIKEILN